jgi:hypothetical protein
MDDLHDGRIPVAHLIPVWLGLAAVQIDHRPAIALAREGLSGEEGRHGVYPFTTSVDHYLGLLAAGDVDEAEKHLTDGVIAHRRAGARPWEALRLHALAMTQSQLGGQARAESATHRRSAAALAASIGMPWPPTDKRLEDAPAEVRAKTSAFDREPLADSNRRLALGGR